MTAGAVLRQARNAAGLTQREVAARAGVQQSVVSAYESGGREPSLATLSSLVEACGMTWRCTSAKQRRPGSARASSDRSDVGCADAAQPCWPSPPGTA